MFRTILRLSYLSMIRQPKMYKFINGEVVFNPNIDLQTFNTIRAEAKGIQLFDVREPIELEVDGRIPDAVNIPLADVDSAFSLGDAEFTAKYGVKKPAVTDDNCVFVCRSGKRGLKACKSLEKFGYKKILNLQGGYMAWKEQE